MVIPVKPTARNDVLDKLRGYARAKAMEESWKGTHLDKDANERVKRRLDELTEMIDSVSDDVGARVLSLRFVNMMDWQAIADKLELSTSTVFRHYRAALDELEANEKK